MKNILERVTFRDYDWLRPILTQNLNLVIDKYCDVRVYNRLEWLDVFENVRIRNIAILDVIV